MLQKVIVVALLLCAVACSGDDGTEPNGSVNPLDAALFKGKWMEIRYMREFIIDGRIATGWPAEGIPIEWRNYTAEMNADSLILHYESPFKTAAMMSAVMTPVRTSLYRQNDTVWIGVIHHLVEGWPYVLGEYFRKDETIEVTW